MPNFSLDLATIIFGLAVLGAIANTIKIAFDTGEIKGDVKDIKKNQLEISVKLENHEQRINHLEEKEKEIRND